MPPHHRVNWEFFAVVRGEMAPSFPDQTTPLCRDTLWIFSPASSHGWIGKKHHPCDVFVFHFNSVSALLQQVMPEAGWLAVPLDKSEKAEVKRIHAMLAPHYWQPRGISDAYADKALAELTLLCLGKLPDPRLQTRRNPDLVMIEKVEDWMQTHLSTPPTVRGAARATGISESSLYRLFREIRKTSPQQAILNYKIERATELLAKNNAKLEDIAQQCGFSNASALCRAFKSMKGCSPKAWLREIFIQYKRPPKWAVEDHTKHGQRKRVK